MNAREQDAHLDLCRRLATALNERDAARAEGDKQGAARVREAVEALAAEWAVPGDTYGTRLLRAAATDLRAALTEAAPHD